MIMTQEEINIAGEKAYKIEKDKGNITDINSAVAFKLGWEAALKLFAIHTVSNCNFCHGTGKYLDTHPERYGVVKCECKK